MKILLIGEYSNVHFTLEAGLRALGHNVTLISNGDFWKHYDNDINISRRYTKLGGIIYMLKLYHLLPRLRGYDIVQVINPIFLELTANRILPIYKYLQKHNKKMILGGFGMDFYWINECCERKPFRYDDFNIDDKLRVDDWSTRYKREWIGTPKEALTKYIANDCDGIVAGLYEYWVCYQPIFPSKTTFIPFPIVPENNEPTHIFDGKRVRIFIGMQGKRSEYKGTDIMLRAAKAIVERYPGKAELQVTVSLPFHEYVKEMEKNDVILDQLYSYTPAMNALEAMSKGIICVGGGEPENYEIINESTLRPIINVQPTYESVYDELEKLILHPERIPELKRQSIEYVRKHHDYIKVARRYEAFYKSL